MTITDLIKLLPPTGLALLELVLEEAAETDPGDDELLYLYRAKTATVNAGVSLCGLEYHDLVWAIGIAVEHAVEDAPSLAELEMTP